MLKFSSMTTYSCHWKYILIVLTIRPSSVMVQLLLCTLNMMQNPFLHLPITIFKFAMLKEWQTQLLHLRFLIFPRLLPLKYAYKLSTIYWDFSLKTLTSISWPMNTETAHFFSTLLVFSSSPPDLTTLLSSFSWALSTFLRPAMRTIASWYLSGSIKSKDIDCQENWSFLLKSWWYGLVTSLPYLLEGV